jgi:hypothetical protein
MEEEVSWQGVLKQQRRKKAGRKTGAKCIGVRIHVPCLLFLHQK